MSEQFDHGMTMVQGKHLMRKLIAKIVIHQSNHSNSRLVKVSKTKAH